MRSTAAPETQQKTTLRRRAVTELKELAVLTIYFYVTLGAIILLKTAILHDQGINFIPWGLAAVKALLLAKFMLIGQAFKIGDRFMARPLIWPTLHKSAAFLLLLVALSVIEEIVVGWLHHRPATSALAELFGAKRDETAADILIMFLVLVPYCGMTVLGRALGEGTLARMFFVQAGSSTSDTRRISTSE